MKIQIGRNIFINKPINAHRIDQTQTLAVYALRSNRKQRVGHKNVKEKDDKENIWAEISLLRLRWNQYLKIHREVPKHHQWNDYRDKKVEIKKEWE